MEIPESELHFSFARSGGPGGQNVNKLNTKAVLRWNLRESPSVPEETRAVLLEKLASRINEEGELVLSCDRHRDQLSNREDCLERLRELIEQALFVPKARRKTRPSRAARERRLTAKRQTAEKKRLRGKISD